MRLKSKLQFCLKKKLRVPEILQYLETKSKDNKVPTKEIVDEHKVVEEEAIPMPEPKRGGEKEKMTEAEIIFHVSTTTDNRQVLGSTVCSRCSEYQLTVEDV